MYIDELKTKEYKDYYRDATQDIVTLCHGIAKETGCWPVDPTTGDLIPRNKGELLCLIHSEISECMEGVRKGLQDTHLPDRSSEEVELADAVIRIFDYAGAYGLDIGGAVVDKLVYNSTRDDHKKSTRDGIGGKKF